MIANLHSSDWPHAYLDRFRGLIEQMLDSGRGTFDEGIDSGTRGPKFECRNLHFLWAGDS